MLLAIAVISIIVLIALHELGHFAFARLFGVKVEEFGVGIPPRVLGRKFGETLYSLNLLPFGAFVKMEGEEDRSPGPRSFSGKPVRQRFLIVAGGVAVFWLVGAVILGVLGASSGIPAAVSDEDTGALPAHVQILEVLEDSPASAAGLQIGDRILAIGTRAVDTVGEVQDVSASRAGSGVTLKIQRGGEVRDVSLVPREAPPPGEGAMGVALARVGLLRFSPLEALWEAPLLTGRITGAIVKALGELAAGLFSQQGLPPGAQVAGPIGIVQLAQDSAERGLASFAYFIALISIHLALFNALPVPALDGGRMFFLLLEAVRKRPLPEAVEKRSIAVSFALLLLLIIAVSIMDVTR